MNIKAKDGTSLMNRAVTFDGQAAINWVIENIEPRELYGEKRIVEDVRSEYEPEFVYGKKALEEWARDNGYVKATSDPAPVSGVATGERGGES